VRGPFHVFTVSEVTISWRDGTVVVVVVVVVNAYINTAV